MDFMRWIKWIQSNSYAITPSWNTLWSLILNYYLLINYNLVNKDNNIT